MMKCFSFESIAALQDLALRRILKPHLNALRKDALTDQPCLPWAQEKAESGYWVMATTKCSKISYYKLRCTEESGLAQNHEADSGTDRTQVQCFLSGHSGEWKHSRPSWCLQAPYHLPLLATAVEQLLPSRATVTSDLNIVKSNCLFSVFILHGQQQST